MKIMSTNSFRNRLTPLVFRAFVEGRTLSIAVFGRRFGPLLIQAVAVLTQVFVTWTVSVWAAKLLMVGENVATAAFVAGRVIKPELSPLARNVVRLAMLSTIWLLPRQFNLPAPEVIPEWVKGS